MNNRFFYPDNWSDLACACKERAGWACEQCGAKQYDLSDHPTVIYLHAAHLNHDARHPELELRCLCQSCHGRHDFQQRLRQQRVDRERLKHRLALTACGMWYGG